MGNKDYLINIFSTQSSICTLALKVWEVKVFYKLASYDNA